MADDDNNTRTAAQTFLAQRLGRPVGQEEAREAERNIVGFVELLLAWDAASRDAEPRTKAHDEATS